MSDQVQPAGVLRDLAYVAARLSTTVRAVTKFVRSGQLRYVDIGPDSDKRMKREQLRFSGRHLRFRDIDIEAFIVQRTRVPETAAEPRRFALVGRPSTGQAKGRFS